MHALRLCHLAHRRLVFAKRAKIADHLYRASLCALFLDNPLYNAGTRSRSVQHGSIATCNAKNARYNSAALHCATRNVQRAPRNVQRAPCSVTTQWCNTQRAPRNVQHATCTTQHATRNVQHATCRHNWRRHALRKRPDRYDGQGGLRPSAPARTYRIRIPTHGR